MRQRHKDADTHAGNEKSAEQSLDEDGILDLSKGRLLDPYFAVKDLADEISFLIPGNPRLILVAVARSETVEGALGDIVRVGGFVVRAGEQFPWSEMTVMHTVKNLSGG